MAVNNNETVIIYTDGGCEPNPGLGGWGVVMQYKGTLKELSGSEAVTTNNRMELTAVIKGLRSLKESSKVELWSDSTYVVYGLRDWLDAWIERGWRTAAKKPVKNMDLWEQLAELREVHEITCFWVKGHASHPENERCDELATRMIDKFR